MSSGVQSGPTTLTVSVSAAGASIRGETLSFDRITADPAKGEGLSFNFRFFQDISGEILVPAGFTPEQVEVIAQAKGRKATKLDRRFDWKAREVPSDVGKG